MNAKKLVRWGAGFLISAIAMSVVAETLVVNTRLKNPVILEVVRQSVEFFLQYEGDEIAGGLVGDLEDVTIIEITKENGEVTKLKVRSKANYMSTDFDFGDPVDEEETICISTLLKVAGKYTVQNATTTCDFDPSAESKFHECCANGVVVDSNYCFDSFEEGLEACGFND